MPIGRGEDPECIRYRPQFNRDTKDYEVIDLFDCDRPVYVSGILEDAQEQALILNTENLWRKRDGYQPCEGTEIEERDCGESGEAIRDADDEQLKGRRAEVKLQPRRGASGLAACKGRVDLAKVDHRPSQRRHSNANR